MQLAEDLVRLQNSQFPVRLAVRADRAHTGPDFLRIPLASITSAASKALTELLPEEAAIPPCQVRVSIRQGRRMANNMPDAAMYIIEVQCMEAHAAQLKAAITSRGYLTMEWGRTRSVRASLFATEPGEAQYLLHLMTGSYSPLNPTACHDLLSAPETGLTVTWVVEIQASDETANPWVVKSSHGNAAPDFSWLDVTNIPGRRFIALVQGGHTFVRSLFNGLALVTPPMFTQSLEIIGVRGWRLAPTVPFAHLDVAAAQQEANEISASTGRRWETVRPGGEGAVLMAAKARQIVQQLVQQMFQRLIQEDEAAQPMEEGADQQPPPQVVVANHPAAPQEEGSEHHAPQLGQGDNQLATLLGAGGRGQGAPGDRGPGAGGRGQIFQGAGDRRQAAGDWEQESRGAGGAGGAGGQGLGGRRQPYRVRGQTSQHNCRVRGESNRRHHRGRGWANKQQCRGRGAISRQSRRGQGTWMSTEQGERTRGTWRLSRHVAMTQCSRGCGRARLRGLRVQPTSGSLA
jgi:hypothetical protein